MLVICANLQGAVKQSEKLSFQSYVQAEKVMTNAIPALLTWLHRFQRREPDQGATLEVRDKKHGTRMEAVAIPEVVDIEESIWVPRYGLKGMIDASVQLRCQPVGPHGPMQALQASAVMFKKQCHGMVPNTDSLPRPLCMDRVANTMSISWTAHMCFCIEICSYSIPLMVVP